MAALAPVLLVLLLAGCRPGAAQAPTAQNNAYGHFLYVWAGETNKTQGDTMFVIGWNNALVGGHPYGSIITYSSFNAAGGEPTSMSLASLNYLMAGATSQGYYTGQKKNQSEVFFWNMTDAKYIKPLSSSNPPKSSAAQDFYPLATGGFLATMMGNAYGGPGGKVAEFDNLGNLVAEYPPGPVLDLAPKGIAVNPTLGLMLTTDYVVPNSTFLPSSGIVTFNTVRIWNFTNRSIKQTTVLPDTNVGVLQVKFLPFDGQARAYVVGRHSGKIYLVTTKPPYTAVVALDLNTVPGLGPGSLPGQFDLAAGGLFNQTAIFYRVGFITLTGLGKVMYFDWTNYAAIVVKQVFNLPLINGRPPPAPNSLRIDLCCGTQGSKSKDSYRFVVTDYSLDQTLSGPKPAATGNTVPLPQPYGLVQEKGTRKVYVFIFNATSIYIDPRFNLDFETRFSNKKYNPRGISMFPITAGGGV